VVEGWVPVPREARVFNFEVEGDHTYFVGDDGVWVHNACGPGAHGHHVFPQTYRPWFEGRGIDIDEYIVDLPSDVHLGQLHAQNIETSAGPMSFPPGGIWNESWRQFIGANPNATQGQILEFGQTLCAGFGLFGAGCP